MFPTSIKKKKSSKKETYLLLHGRLLFFKAVPRSFSKDFRTGNENELEEAEIRLREFNH